MQSIRLSAIEATTNILLGYVVASIANFLILPLFGCDVTAQVSFEIGAVFTLISWLRSFLLRRLFTRIKS